MLKTCNTTQLATNSPIGVFPCSGTTTTVSYDFEVNSISPETGSLVGGSLVTLTGKGLDSVGVQVLIGQAPCEVVSSDANKLTCTTPPVAARHIVDNSGTHASE